MGKDPNVLIVEVGRAVCAIRVADVIETMRPLPIDPIASASPAVLGVAVIRGLVTPVVSLARALGIDAGDPMRFVTVRAGARQIALAVGAVTGLRAIELDRFAALPPLVTVDSAIGRVAALDGQLAAVLDHARLVPDDVWSEIR